ncbi:hypothetical protein [Sphingomonas sp. GC_Shp_3]|uniref:hypothetical protein n=1 Tax=Sphingomonas sp. GC_Shp_3 TaxID=2937383 RepID=UPI002269842B|nr:hypothetical protein [Sphingomonas sp. GC_Shp_3]
MNAHLAGGLALLIVVPGAFMTRQDYRNGVSRFWLSGGIDMFTFRRYADPAFFWGSTIVNVMLIGLILLGAVAALILPTHA